MRLTGEDLWFRYGSRTILSGVSLSVTVGQAVAILGPSGVGKTTLLSLLGGMLRPQSGRVVVDGDSHPGEWVAWALQTVNVLGHRSVLDNTMLGALADGVNRRDAYRIAMEKLGQVGLLGLESTPARKLSGGELQRVVIARGLASRRPFILADEPTGQLDTTTTDVVVDCLLATRTERGILVVTHDQAVADRCDRVYHLVDGHLTEADEHQKVADGHLTSADERINTADEHLNATDGHSAGGAS